MPTWKVPRRPRAEAAGFPPRRKRVQLSPWRRGAFVLAATLVTLVPSPSLSESSLCAQEPEPFRGDEVDGRGFDYSSKAFLQRFSYRFDIDTTLWWRQRPEGFRGTAGSISSDEFFVVEDLRLTARLNDPLFFEIRHSRREDFDARYSRTLTGVGLELADTGADVRVLAEIVAEKELIDTQFELNWRGAGGSRGRLAALLVDAVGSKSDEVRDRRRLWTWYADGRWQVNELFAIGGWLDVDSPVRRDLLLRGLRFSARPQVAAGVDLDLVAGDWTMLFHGESSNAARTRRSDGLLPDLDQEFRRRHLDLQLDVRRDLGVVSLRGGLRYFRLSELDRRPSAPHLATGLRRREWIGNLGVDYSLAESERWGSFALSPTLYVDRIDLRESSPAASSALDRDEGYLAKLGLPLRVRWSSADLWIQPTVGLRPFGFGGGNVQLVMRF